MNPFSDHEMRQMDAHAAKVVQRQEYVAKNPEPGPLDERAQRIVSLAKEIQAAFGYSWGAALLVADKRLEDFS